MSRSITYTLMLMFAAVNAVPASQEVAHPKLDVQEQANMCPATVTYRKGRVINPCDRRKSKCARSYGANPPYLPRKYPKVCERSDNNDICKEKVDAGMARCMATDRFAEVKCAITGKKFFCDMACFCAVDTTLSAAI